MLRTKFLFSYFILFLMVGVPVFAQTKDFPLKGEGARAFLRRHNLEGENFYNEFIRLNDRKLGKNHTLLQGIKYTLPSKPEKTDTVETSAAVESESDTTVKKVEVKQETKKKSTGKKIHEPLFGKKEQDFEVIDNELAGATFFLSSGHGGPDCGAVAKVNGHELHEDEYAYDIVLRLAKNLMKHGATVHIIIQDKKDGIRDDLYLANSKRETCMGKEIPLNQKKRLKQRTDKINSLSAQASGQYKRALFVHLDSRSEKEQLDVFFYYQNGNTASLRLAETVRKTFRSKYEEHQPGRGFSGTVSTRPLAVLKNTNIVSLFVELANMQNVNDQKRYVLADNRQALANWLALGFIRDYKNSK